MTIDWHKPEGEGRFKYVDYSVRQCVQADFGTGPKAVTFFETWAGFSLLCPDLPEGVSLVLQGNTASMVT
jgi:hypothetical protein